MLRAICVIIFVICLPFTVAAQSAFMQQGSKGSCLTASGDFADSTSALGIYLGLTPNGIVDFGTNVAVALGSGNGSATAIGLQLGVTIPTTKDPLERSFGITTSVGYSLTFTGEDVNSTIGGFVLGIQLFSRPSSAKTVQAIPMASMGAILTASHDGSPSAFAQFGIGLLIPTSVTGKLLLMPTVNFADGNKSIGISIGSVTSSQRLHRIEEDF